MTREQWKTVLTGIQAGAKYARLLEEAYSEATGQDVTAIGVDRHAIAKALEVIRKLEPQYE